MPLTVGQLNRSTLHRQLLLQRESLSVPDAVRRIVAIQAQEPASPYLALWNRVAGFDPDDLDHAFAHQDVVKASLMRITLHAVATDEYTRFHESMLPALRGSRLHDNRFRNTGMTIEEADAMVPHLLEFADTPRTRAEIEAHFTERLGDAPDQRLWWALRTYAPLVHVSDGGTWGFGRSPSFRIAPMIPKRVGRDEALEYLFRRYLEGFGPATRHDIGRFTLIAQSTIKPILEQMDDLVRHDGPGGEELFDVPSGEIPDADTPAPPRLMAMWDSVLLAHADRSRIIDEEHRKVVIRNNGDVLPTVLVNGRVAGVWRPLEGRVEARVFYPVGDDDWQALEKEAALLLGLLDSRDPAVYSRYARWWNAPEIAGAESRLLGS